MANHASAEKSLRKCKKVTAQNRSQMSALRTACRRVREDLEAKDVDKLGVDLSAMQRHLMRGAQRNLIHKNKMRRLISRAAKRLKAL